MPIPGGAGAGEPARGGNEVVGARRQVGGGRRTRRPGDVRQRERVGDHFPKIPGWVPQVGFEPNGRLLLTEGGSASEWPVDRPTLQRFACRVAGRSLSRDEWRAVLPNQPYRRVCR